MDFIEKAFGLAPDNGSGLFEVTLFLVPVLVVAAIAIRRRWLAGQRH